MCPQVQERSTPRLNQIAKELFAKKSEMKETRGWQNQCNNVKNGMACIKRNMEFHRIDSHMGEIFITSLYIFERYTYAVP